MTLDTVRLAGPLCRARDHLPDQTELTPRSEAPYIDRYHSHNAEIRAYFADKPDSLLEVCWESVDGWPELCSFLDTDVPAVPFPHRNRDPATEYHVQRRGPRRISEWLKRAARATGVKRSRS